MNWNLQYFALKILLPASAPPPEKVYLALTEKSDILSSYIVPEYEVLHTQSKEYIVRDILDVMKERGVYV